MNELVRRCTFTVEYHSKAFVEDALYFARWILRLQSTDAVDRESMLSELGVGETVSEERRAALVADAEGLEEMAKRLRKGTTDPKFLSGVAMELDVRAREIRTLAEPTKEAPATTRKAVPGP